MVDDQSRPPENDNQDAEREAPDSPEASEPDVGTRKSRPASDATDTESDADTEPGDRLETEGSDDPADDEGLSFGESIDEEDPDADATAEERAGDEGDGDDEEDAGDEERAAGEEDGADLPEDENDDTDLPEDVRKYERFKKMDGAQYDRVNEFLRDRTYITAREWAIARLCADFRTETGVEMTKIGENLPELVPFMTDSYTPQAVNQARSSFEDKVRQAGATFLYGAMSGFFTAEEPDDMMYEVTEVAKFLLEVEGVDLSVDEELEAEDRISGVMREVRSASEQLRHDELECPNCGHEMEASDGAEVGSDD